MKQETASRDETLWIHFLNILSFGTPNVSVHAQKEVATDNYNGRPSVEWDLASLDACMHESRQTHTDDCTQWLVTGHHHIERRCHKASGTITFHMVAISHRIWIKIIGASWNFVAKMRWPADGAKAWRSECHVMARRAVKMQVISEIHITRNLLRFLRSR